MSFLHMTLLLTTLWLTTLRIMTLWLMTLWLKTLMVMTLQLMTLWLKTVLLTTLQPMTLWLTTLILMFYVYDFIAYNFMAYDYQLITLHLTLQMAGGFKSPLWSIFGTILWSYWPKKIDFSQMSMTIPPILFRRPKMTQKGFR